MLFTVRPLYDIFAAELIGADLERPPTSELVQCVEEAMARYAVLVVRGQRITDQEHIRFSRAFGPLELPPSLGTNQAGSNAATRRTRMRPELFDAGNLDDTGQIASKESRKHEFNKGAQRFHSDSSFNSLPTKWSLLLGHVVPPEGANTEFIDTRAVYDALAPEMKARIETLVAEHDLWRARERGGLTGVTQEMRRAMPPARHPLVRRMPYGRKALYLGAHAVDIVGWPHEAGLALIDELYELATQERFVYSHKWLEGDLVIWDNRCTMHRATPFDHLKYRRDVRRTTINEYGPETSSTAALAAY